MNFDIELMVNTSERMVESLVKQLEVLHESHGEDFTRSVMGNIGCHMLTSLLAAELDDDERFIKLLTIIKVLGINIKAESASNKADEIIERIKKGLK